MSQNLINKQGWNSSLHNLPSKVWMSDKNWSKSTSSFFRRYQERFKVYLISYNLPSLSQMDDTNHKMYFSGVDLWFNISSAESQKGVIAVQRCSVENQKGTIAVKCMAIVPFWFSMEHLWSAITPFWLSTDKIFLSY